MLDVLRAVKVPRNQTAAMQLLQLYAQSGHVLWTAGRVVRGKLERLLAKLAPFRIDRNVPGRAYDRSRGLASCHLVITDSEDEVLDWVLVSTQGRQGLGDPGAPDIGTIYDTTAQGQHLRWGLYELLHTEKRIGKVRDTTWTWRITRPHYKAHEALIVERAKRHDVAGLTQEIAALAMMPMFSGVRGQVLKLYAEARKVAGKFGVRELTLPVLAYMTRQTVYDTPPATLVSLLPRVGVIVGGVATA
ncbi:hypothetical protein [Zoogloea sp.]|uniref:hypothetical protein n=1 Tax=Zoogloea sp. TaxID=49181 RepID=UPI00260F8DA8|nr:hypothetical protein [Zoogloea sp.]